MIHLYRLISIYRWYTHIYILYYYCNKNYIAILFSMSQKFIPVVICNYISLTINLLAFIWICFKIYREERQKKILNPLVHSPNGCNGWSWRPKQGARSFFLVSHVDAGSQELSHFPLLSHTTTMEIDVKWNSWDMSWCPFGIPALEGGGLDFEP